MKDVALLMLVVLCPLALVAIALLASTLHKATSYWRVRPWPWVSETPAGRVLEIPPLNITRYWHGLHFPFVMGMSTTNFFRVTPTGIEYGVRKERSRAYEAICLRRRAAPVRVLFQDRFYGWAGRGGFHPISDGRQCCPARALAVVSNDSACAAAD